MKILDKLTGSSTAVIAGASVAAIALSYMYFTQEPKKVTNYGKNETLRAEWTADWNAQLASLDTNGVPTADGHAPSVDPDAASK